MWVLVREAYLISKSWKSVPDTLQGLSIRWRSLCVCGGRWGDGVCVWWKVRACRVYRSTLQADSPLNTSVRLTPSQSLGNKTNFKRFLFKQIQTFFPRGDCPFCPCSSVFCPWRTNMKHFNKALLLSMKRIGALGDPRDSCHKAPLLEWKLNILPPFGEKASKKSNIIWRNTWKVHEEKKKKHEVRV